MMDIFVSGFFFFLSLQVHVVRPVLNRIDTLIQTTVNNNQGNTTTEIIFTFNFFLFCLISNI